MTRQDALLRAFLRTLVGRTEGRLMAANLKVALDSGHLPSAVVQEILGAAVKLEPACNSDRAFQVLEQSILNNLNHRFSFQPKISENLHISTVIAYKHHVFHSKTHRFDGLLTEESYGTSLTEDNVELFKFNLENFEFDEVVFGDLYNIFWVTSPEFMASFLGFSTLKSQASRVRDSIGAHHLDSPDFLILVNFKIPVKKIRVSAGNLSFSRPTFVDAYNSRAFKAVNFNSDDTGWGSALDLACPATTESPSLDGAPEAVCSRLSLHDVGQDGIDVDFIGYLDTSPCHSPARLANLIACGDAAGGDANFWEQIADHIADTLS